MFLVSVYRCAIPLQFDIVPIDESRKREKKLVLGLTSLWTQRVMYIELP